MNCKIILLGIGLSFFVSINAQQKNWIDLNQNGEKDLYENPDASIDARVKDLLSKLTVEEKIDLMVTSSSGVPRLGIPRYYHGNEALHGVVRPGRFTVFPQAIALASMWSPDLHYKIATAISDEARARWNELERGKAQLDYYSDLLTFWSPTVNMARDPRWGRTPETYGEDPFLSGTLGAQFVKGLQGNDKRYLKVVSTPKHFAGNNEEHNRFVCDVQMTERQLREYYLPAFEKCVKEGRAASIMTSYTAINGVPSTANFWLLTKVLRRDWGFNGYVVCDCGAAGLIADGHKYVKTKETAATLAIKAGMDLECGDDVFRHALLKAHQQFMVTDADIDTAAYHVLRSKMRLGIFDSPGLNPYDHLAPSVVGSKEHQQLALEASRQSIVLLKNKQKTLPINPKKVKSIAVVGINAGSCEFGDYSGKPANAPVSILQGIQNRVGKDVTIVYAPWKSSADGKEMITKNNFPGELKAEYYANKHLQGEPKIRMEEWINFEPANQAPDPLVPQSPVSIRWTGKLRPEISGYYTLFFKVDDACRLNIDGKQIINTWDGITPDTARIYLEAGKNYDLKAEYFDDRDYAVARLYWRIPGTVAKERIDLFGEAGKAAKNCEKVIVVLGMNKSNESEGLDRGNIELPTDQKEFIEEIYKINKNIVVVLVAGSSLAINWIDEHIPAIVNAWYPGEQGGNAVAEVLFGDYNPAGRLPITYYNSLDEIPAFNDYDITKGRTYQYFEGKPLYPFGYGLSYTSFQYSNLKAEDIGKSIKVSFNLKNTGSMDGDEVSQVYVKLPQLGIPIPNKELKGFQRIFLKKGENKKIEIEIEKESLRYWDEKSNQFVVPSGIFQLMIGASSEDIRQKIQFEIINITI